VYQEFSRLDYSLYSQLQPLGTAGVTRFGEPLRQGISGNKLRNSDRYGQNWQFILLFFLGWFEVPHEVRQFHFEGWRSTLHLPPLPKGCQHLDRQKRMLG